MRLSRLDLTRYGRFTDFSLDFGASPEGAMDLHIVYGPNEAGKSTAFSAFLDLLFGIEARSRYNFLHAYGAMQVGAKLEWDGAAHEFTRVKRSGNSLLGPNGQPVADTGLRAALGGIDRDSYRTMFSLDDETLEKGGEAILQSRGDLGQLLFAASAGLADLSRTLEALQAEAESFHKFRAHKTELSLLKAQLAELKDARERIDTLASTYAHLVAERDASRRAYEEAARLLAETRGRTERARGLLAAHAPWLRAAALAREIGTMGALPEPPDHWADDLPLLAREEVELETRRATSVALMERLDREIADVPLDALALGLGTRFRQLGELAARAVKADQDLPAERADAAEAERGVAAILRRLGRNGADPASLLVATDRVVRLRALIAESGIVETRLDAARKEASAAAERLEEARAALRSAGGASTVSLAAVKAALAAWRGSDAPARHRLAAGMRDAQADLLHERLLVLAPWHGGAEELAALALPAPERFESWSASLAAARSALARAAEERRRLEGERARLEAALEADRSAGLPDEAELRAARERRDRAWAAHRVALDTASADGFEAALRADDRAAAASLAYAGEAARHRETARALALALAALGKAVAEEERAGRDLQAAGAEVESALEAVSPLLPKDWPIEEWRGWATRGGRALEAWSALRAAERDVRAAERDMAEAGERLARALAESGTSLPAGASAEALAAAADAAVEREAELRALSAEAQARERESGLREARLKQAGEEAEAWDAAWREACGATWLDPDAGPGAVRALLDALADLGPVLERQAGCLARIGRMEREKAGFATETKAVGLLLGVSRDEPMAAFESIGARVRGAELVEEARRAKTKEREAAGSTYDDLERRMALHARRVAEITGFFGAGSLAEAGRMLGECARRRTLREARAQALAEAARALGEADAEPRAAELDALDPAALQAEISELGARLETEEARARELYAGSVKASDRVENVGGDDAVARIEEKRRTVLLDIEERALNHLRLRVGIAAAEAGLRAYRDAHRSSMMEEASAAFRTVSRGAYSSLDTQPGRDGDVLVGIAADGASKLAADMSKGTRFQLYLALRVAGHAEFARARAPVPFVADDIMETFDDLRAEEAFRLFAKMAGVGQVIYLTHHRHLCDIARAVCPGVKVHELPAG